MQLRTRADLLTLAGQYANQRKVPASTVIKEILHYEILYALTQSGAAASLIFQGGTALRLCYQGTRYSEDLDFASSADFKPESMASFSKLLHQEISEAYDLEVEISAPKAKEPAKGIRVARWKAKVHVPQVDLSISQNQLINIEVADVPAYDIDLVAVAANYPHLPAPHRQLIIATKTLREILADKLVALGARPYLKARDIWDIKFLTDRQVIPDITLIARKLKDYGLNQNDFKGNLQAKLAELENPLTAKVFHQEMSRFVDANVASQLANPALTERFLHRSKEVGLAVLSTDLGFNEKPRPQLRH